MKTGLIVLLIFNVLESVKTEFRHHQQQERLLKSNVTFYPWSSTTTKERQVTEISRDNDRYWTISLDGLSGEDVDEEEEEEEEEEESNNSLLKAETSHPFYVDNSNPDRKGSARQITNQTNPGQGYENLGNDNINIIEDGISKKRKKKRENIKNDKKTANNDSLREENTTKNFAQEYIFRVSKPSNVKRKVSPGIVNVSSEILFENNLTEEAFTKNQILDENINSTKEALPGNSIFFESVDSSEKNENFRLYESISKSHYAEPLIAVRDVPSADNGCVRKTVDDFVVRDELVSKDVMEVKTQAEKYVDYLAGMKIDTSGGMQQMTKLAEQIMNKYLKILSISISYAKETDNLKLSRTVYRKGLNILVDGQPNRYPPSDGKASWTSVFEDCLIEAWIFGYSFTVSNPSERVDITIYFGADNIEGSANQCHPSNRFGGPKCDLATTECVPVQNSGFYLGGYKCTCRTGFYFPEGSNSSLHYFSGADIEKNSNNGNLSQFRCIPCPDTCPDSCNLYGFCVVKKFQLLKNVILSIQVSCVLGTFLLTIVVFKHRKCKTIATGMWTIMEMILLGSIILYVTVLVRAFYPSTQFCLLEPWCREVGFVICYGAIILKLYRILIEFRTRKAHRWVVRDKDLLKYLLGMIIVVFGYMAAWTATNLNLIQKENYSMLTTGITDEGVQFHACKAVWWDYVTETGEILILIFGVHLSYASRNASTQFQERCFLCVAITVEALISGTFYVLRFFYWETMQPDLNFVAYFARSQLTTTIVLLLVFIPKWWYQHFQVNKSRVSRNYLMQESGRGPLEAFKPQDGVTATNSDVEGEINLADMNPEDIRAELKRLYTQLEVLKNKTIRFDNPHISKRRGGRKIAHRRFSLQKKGSREKALRQQAQRLSAKQNTDVEVTEAEPSRTPEDSVCSNEGPSIIINDGPSDIVHATPKKCQK